MAREIRFELGEECLYDDDVLQSVYPGNLARSFGYWIHLVPWRKPSNVLMLGYGMGTLSRLLRDTWGPEVRIVGVDRDTLCVKESQDIVINEDALQFVARQENPGQYDLVIVDLAEGEIPPAFVRSEAFVQHVARVTSEFVAVNVIGGWGEEDPFAKVMDLVVTKIIGESKLGNHVYFYRKRYDSAANVQRAEEWERPVDLVRYDRMIYSSPHQRADQQCAPVRGS